MRKTVLTALLMAIALPLQAAGLVASHAWIRLLPGDLPLAGYVELHNAGNATLTLVAVSSPEFADIQIHRSMRHAGMESMMRITSLTIAAGQTLDFAPGGYHLMLMRRRHPLRPGDVVTMTFAYANGETQTVRFTVKGTDTQ